ncbi:MAG: DUF2807 domain-containing protein [Ferruginibacter sp.]|nr:DUF2807 domain-containing protein [Ferruginibacter sp.]
MKLILSFALILIAFTACRQFKQMRGSGNIITENKTVGDFNSISVGGALEVELKNGDATEVKVEADDNLMKYVDIHVSGNTLKIKSEGLNNLNNAHLKVFITAPNINQIKSSGAATVSIKGILKNNDKINMEASGAANINGEVDAPEIDTEASGAANIDISGRTKSYKANASGSGTVKSSDLMSETTNAHASGAGTVHVYSSVSMDAEASGAGTVHYKGGGSISQKVSGAGNIKKDD